MGTQAHRSAARDRLLDAADELFYTHGIGATAVDAVLKRADVSVATLYAHFGSKDGLLQASLERRLERWQVQWENAIAAATSDLERLLALFDALRLYRERTPTSRWCAFLLTTAEAAVTDQRAHELSQVESSLLRQRLGSLAAPLTDAPDELADAVLLIYNGVLASLLRGYPEDPIPRGRAMAAVLAAEAAGRGTPG